MDWTVRLGETVQTEVPKIEPITTPDAPVPAWIPFQINEQLPFKGYWFTLFEIREDRLKFRVSGMSKTAGLAGWSPITKGDLLKHKGFLFSVVEVTDDFIVITPLHRLRRRPAQKGRFKI
jgi:hypothetical protein